ncbi:MAG: GlsB/YeaQ/YmgE family stress response membrane protein [Acidobacteria bacterium]|nr:GlsB/YeaQ/YmgE family stress response membrane protein [Acidobacteriota bacterium]
MFSLIGTALFGLVVGALAKLVMPGKDPGGILITMGLGIAGAFVGSFAGRMLGFYGPGDGAGFIMSTLGAVALLYIYRRIKTKPA